MDTGWGPSSVVQWMLEHVYIYSGFPWWASIFATALIFRIALFPLFVKQSEMSARMMAVKPETDKLKEKINRAKAVGDTKDSTQVAMEYRKINRLAGVQMRWMFIPIVVNGFLGLGTFRFCRAGADLPIPGWETGGMLWLTDLTIPDPYYLTPIIFAAVMHTFVRVGSVLFLHHISHH